jgi:hypothetical protein
MCLGASKRRTVHALSFYSLRHIEDEIREEIDNPRVVPEPAERMVVGMWGSMTHLLK